MIYRVERLPNGEVSATVDGIDLPTCNEIVNHSPCGFEYGYFGSGPAQLALAILVNHFGDQKKALDYYQDFKALLISKMLGDYWEIDTDKIDGLLGVIRKQRA